MKIVLLHPTGNNFVRAIASAFLQAGILAEFNTTVAVDADSVWLKFLPKALREECKRRMFYLPSGQLNTYPTRELARLILPKLGLNHFVRHEHGPVSLDAVYRNFDLAVAIRLPVLAKKQKLNAVYAYEDGALETFKSAKKLGLKCIYDLPIAYWEAGRKLLMEEAERMPDWAATLSGGIQDSSAKLERKTRELELADVVVGPGQFVMDSIPDWARKKDMIMVPFGSPQVKMNKTKHETTFYKTDRPLRVLFAGSMGQRKGLVDLFSAIKLMNTQEVELVVMGSLMSPLKFYRSELSNFTYESNRPHDQVLSLMRSCDIFCLPSIVEGRALVMQEAMSQGLPLIITPNTGGSDLVQEGKTGFIVPIRSPEAIAEKITWFLENRSKIPEMGRLAKAHADRYTWENYGKGIINSLAAIL